MNWCAPGKFTSPATDLKAGQESYLLTKIDHVAIAVRSLELAVEVYERALGLSGWVVEEVPDQKTRVAMLTIGENRLELLEATAADSPVAGFVAKRGEGLHHLCFQVEDLDKELRRLKAAGFRFIEPTVRMGAGGCRIAFLHPSSAAGVLIELSQPGGNVHSNSNSD